MRPSFVGVFENTEMQYCYYFRWDMYKYKDGQKTNGLAGRAWLGTMCGQSSLSINEANSYAHGYFGAASIGAHEMGHRYIQTQFTADINCFKTFDLHKSKEQQSGSLYNDLWARAKRSAAENSSQDSLYSDQFFFLRIVQEIVHGKVIYIYFETSQFE